MTLDELTLEILAERAFTQFDSKKLVDWAVDALSMGYESEDLLILAGLDFETTEERELYFWKCIGHFNLNYIKSDDELLNKYALRIAEKAIRKEINIDFAFGQMLKVVNTSEYDYRYMAFYDIEEDLDYLTNFNTTIFNCGLTLENSKNYILEEFRLFVEMERVSLPENERKKCYCESCKKLNIPITKNKYQLKKPFRFLVWSCGFCGSEKLKFNGDHQVKKMILSEYKKNNT